MQILCKVKKSVFSWKRDKKIIKANISDEKFQWYVKPFQIKANTPFFKKIFPFVFSTILVISMPIILLIASKWRLVVVLICWLYASNSPSAAHPTLIFLDKERHILDYSEYNRFHLQQAKEKSNTQVILLEKYDILIFENL